MKTMPIKEVYEQLPKDKLGRAIAEVRFIEWKGNPKATIIGSMNGLIACWIHYPDEKYGLVPIDAEVQWIGNQPKKKMLYACLALSDPNSNTLQVLYAPKEVVNGITMERVCNDKVCKWLPEEQYPPIEIEDGE